MIARSFSDKARAIACPDPTYSLYPVLAQLQDAPFKRIALDDGFALPKDFAKRAGGANIVMFARPNAPTGNSFPKEDVERLCADFKGIVLIDEAYVDFADDDCVDFVSRFSNVIVSRTFSKSRALAGLRFGYALANAKIIEGMMKVKDSYNVDMLTQILALASLKDPAYFKDCVGKIKTAREKLAADLRGLGFEVEPSRANFLFAAPPDRDGKAYFAALRERGMIVRYFPGERTGAYVRITVGTPEQMERFVAATKAILAR
jgi:histidinol-phosphate aminotransferase